MKRKSIFLRLLLLAALCVPWVTHAQSTLTVADGTSTNDYVPFYGCYADENQHCQFIYPASSLSDMENGTITKLQFYPADYGNDIDITVTISLAEVDATTLSGFLSPGLTEVWSGTVANIADFTTLELDDSYTYGGSNLLVDIQTVTTGSYDCSGSFYGMNQSSNTGYLYYPSNYGSSTKQFLPKLTFTYTTGPVSGCTKPGAITVNDLTATSANISWTAGGSETSWKVYLNNTYVATTSTTSYSFTGLTANTTYTVGVTAMCGSEESGARTTTVTTPCEAATIPYFCGFENSELACWTMVSCHSSTGLYTSGAYEGSKCFRFYYSSNPPQYLISPMLNGTTNGVTVSFYYKAYMSSYPESFKVGYSTTTNETSAFTWDEEVTGISGTSWSDDYFYESTFPAGTKYVAIAYTANYMYYLYIDNIRFEPVSSCPKPASIATTNLTATSMDVAWEEGGSETEWQVLLNGTPVDTVSSKSYSFTSLEPDSNYTIGVAAICSDEVSSVRTVTIQTPCLAVSELPYTYGFEDATGSGSSHSISQCWTVGTNYSTAYPYPYNYYYNSGNYSLYFYGSNSWGSYYSYAALPEMEKDINKLQISFYLMKYAGYSNYPNAVKVGVMIDPNDITTFELVETVTASGSDYSWSEQTVPLYSYTGTGKYIALMCDGTYNNSYDYVYIDDITVDTLPSCWQPTWAEIQAEATANSVTLAWTENTPTPATTWDIAFGAPGFDPDDATQARYRMGVTSNPYTLTGLKHSTIYGVRVRAVCDAENGDHSLWSSEYTFSTPCAPWSISELPLVEEFNGNSLPNCWVKKGGSNGVSSGRMNMYSEKSMVVLPEMGVNLNMLDVKIEAAKFDDYNSNAYPLQIGYLTDFDDTSSFVPVETIELTSSSYNTFTIPFGEVESDASFIAIRGRIYSGTSSWSDVNIRNLEVRLHADVDTLDNAGESKALCNTFIIPTINDNGNYSNNVNATYTLTPATAGTALKLEGTYDLEAGDTLTIYRGINTGKVLYKKLGGSGNIVIDSTNSNWASNNGVTLVLTTNGSNTEAHEGFRLLATCVCPYMAFDSTFVETHSSYTFIMEDEPGTTTSTVVANHATTEAAADVMRQGNQALNTVWHSTVQPDCDSLLQKVQLLLHPDYTLSKDDNFCEGTAYAFMGTTKTAGGVYTETGTSFYGADSTVTLNLQMRAKPTAAVQYNGRNTTAINNLCEGTAISLTARSDNQNSVFEWEDGTTEATRTVTPMATVVYSVVAQDTIYGCYSDTVHVTVTTTPVAEPVITASDTTICAGMPTTLTATDATGLAQSFTWSNGETAPTITVNPEATTTYTVTAKTETGCATTAEITINVNALPEVAMTASATAICLNDEVTLTAGLAEGYSYAWNATAGTGLTSNAATVTPAAAGNYTAKVTVTDANGCVKEFTSPVVTVHPSYEMNYEASACIANLPYSFGTQNLTADGNYDETFTIAYGCDSLVHLAFTVQDTAVNNYYREYCQGTVFTFGDSIYAQEYTATESTVISYINTLGECPVREVLNVTVHMPAATSFEATACDSYTWNETTYTESGNYGQTLATSHGCDSVVTMVLTVNVSNTGIDEQVPCDSLTWIDGITYKEVTGADAPTFTLTNAAGCDSVVTLNITAIKHATVGYDAITWCDTRSYTWIDGETYTMSELDSNITYVLPSTTNAQGCDTTSVLLLTFNLANDTLNWVDTAVCDEFLVNTVLCDGSSEQVSIRESDSVMLRVLDPVSGNPVIARYNVTVTQSSHWTTPVTACVPYDWTIMDRTNSYAVAYLNDIYPMGDDTLISYQMPVMNGCADIQTLYLHALHPEQGVEVAEVCQGGIYYLANYVNIYFNSGSIEPGTYYSNITQGIAAFHTVGNGANGCQIDSILQFTVLPVYNESVSLELCESEFEYNAESGLYVYTINDANHAGQSIDLTYADELEHDNYEGMVTASWQTNDGCDSVINFYYTVYPNESYDTVDVCGSYRGPDGETYQESKGFSEVVGRTANGCDMTAYTYFRMHQRSLEDQYIVSTDPYTWIDGVTYTADTTGVMFNYVVGQCDSTLILHFDRVDTLNLCAASLPYETGYGFTIAAGSVSATYSNSDANGNDTVISYTIDAGLFGREDTTVCDTYTWNGTAYTESGTYIHNYNNENGCPSADTLVLTVNNSYATSFEATQCDSYTWVDSTYEASTVVTKTFEAANECDSVVTMTLTINTHETVVETVAACESYEWNETTYAASGAYAANVVDGNGCAGVDSLYLTINHATSQDSDLIVNAASYYYTDNILRVAPFDTVYTYFFEGGDVNGCDSTLHVHLWVNQGDMIGDTIFHCGNYEWINGHIYTYLSMSERMAHGMAFYYDSTDHSYVTVYPEHSIYNADGSLRETHMLLLTLAEAKYSDTVTVDFPLSQETLTYTGTTEGTTTFDFSAYKNAKYNDTVMLRELRYASISYCDSIVPLKINLIYNYDTTDATVCGTQATYAYNGEDYDLGAAGTTTYITDTLNAGETNEWISTVRVARKAIVDSSFALTACDAFVYNGHTYTTSGIYTDTLTNAAADGCDSITHITLTVNYNTNSADLHTACESYEWHGQTYTASGDYTFAYTAGNGCASVDTLRLTINNHITDTTVVACDQYVWYANPGVTYTESLDDTVTYTDANGCTGETILHLTINNSVTVVEDITTTDGSYRLYGRLYLAEFNDTIDSLYTSTVTGCDSLHRTHLVVTHYQYVYDNAAECGVYTWNRNNHTYGWISSTESAANGNALYKDITDGSYVTSNPTDTIGLTIYMLNLTLSEAALTEADTTFPLSQVVFNLGSESFDYSAQLAAKANATATEIVHFGSTYYCDSIVTYTVNLVYNYDTLDDEVVCYQENTLDWNNHSHALAVGNNEITEVLNAGTVNEQVVTRHIMRRDTVGTEFAQVACDSYTWEGNTYTTTQNVLHTYTDANGCDSVVTMMLTINNNNSHGETPAAACDSYAWHGETYTESGDYTYAYEAANGCASVDTLHLTINKNDGQVITDVACDNYTWMHRDSTEESWTALSGSSFTAFFNFTDENGCPAQDTLMLTVHHANQMDSVLYVSSGSYLYNDTMIVAGQTKQYYYHYTNAEGCDSLFHLTINVGTANYVLEDTTVCDHYTWVNGMTYYYSEAAIAAGALYADEDGNYITSNPVYIDSVNNEAYDTIYILSLSLTQQTTSSDVINFNISHETLTYGDSIFDFTALNTVDFVNTTVSREVHFASQHYCDSVVLLTINLINNHVVLADRDICVTQDSVIVHGETQSTATMDYDNEHVYNFVVYDATEDKYYHQQFTQHPVVYATERRDACDSYTWNGTTFNYSDYASQAVNDTVTISGATAMLVNSNGCDSVVTLVLTLKHNTDFTTSYTACDSYDWTASSDATAKGTFTTSGEYTHNFVNEYGCPSVETLSLTIDHSYADVVEEETACDSYTWMLNGETYTESIDTPKVTLYTTLGSCDSVVTLHLTVNHNTGHNEAQAICANEEVLWNGTTYNEAGMYFYNYETNAGCASVDTLTLTVHPTYNIALAPVTACDSYEWYGVEYTESDSLTKSFESVNGCDSIYTLVLTVNNTVIMPTETVVECQSYTWAENGVTYTTSGIYYDTLTNPATGCDSIHVLDLTIGSGRGFAVETITNCGPFTWVVNGEEVDTFTESIETSTNFTSPLSGCDSVVYLRLTVNPLRDTVATLCETELPFSWRGHSYTEAGQFSDTEEFLTNGVCDSAVRLTVTVNPVLTTNLTDQICLGLGYERYGFSIDADSLTVPGDYNYTKTLTSNQYGCDSIVNLTLTVGELLTNAFEVTACDSYDWNGETYTASGVYTQEFTTAGGCDSIATMTLTINKNSGQTIARSGCYTYTWHGTTYDESGTYTFDYVDANNCASTDTLELTISTSTNTTTEVTACDSYVWNGTTYTQDGTYTHENTIGGCEGIDTLILTLNHSDNVYDIQTACGSYDWNNDTYTQSGVYTGTLTNANGCDSVVNLVLTITQPVSNIVTATACDSYTWIDGETYTASTNTPSVTLTAANGCDSIVTLNLTVYNSTSNTVNETACGSYTWNGATYTNSGNYTQNYLTANGCDSIVTLALTITPAYSTTLSEVACGSYAWNGISYTTSGNYTTTFTAANGCDSVVTLNLTVNQPKTSTLTATACGSYTWEGTTYTTSGNYNKTFTAANGCDSTVTLALTIHNATNSVVTATACDSYTWMNGVTYTASTNTPTVTLFNQYGCDSVVTLHLTINNSVNSTISESACGSYTWNGTTYTTSGNYTYEGTTANGCDSTVTLSLTITPAVTNTITATACGSYTWNGTTYTETGNYSETYTAANGCDSVVTLNLTVNESTSSYTAVASCDSYTWNGNTYTASGVYVTTTTDDNGCPSIDTLDLTISSTIYIVDNQTACDSYTWIDGVTYTASTNSPSMTLTSESGCDSVVTLNLTVNTSDSTTDIVTACGSYTWIDGVTYTASTNVPTVTLTNVNGCDSVVTLNLTVGQPSESTVEEVACDVFIWVDGNTYTESTNTPTYIYTDANGCDSVVTLHLTINHSIEVYDTITVEESQLPYEYNGVSITAAGDYEFNGYTANGCDSTVYLTVYVNAIQGIDVVDVLNNVSVYPNPTRGRLTVSVDNVEKVEVLDIVGRLVATFENTNTFDISNLGEGAYTLRITLPEGITVRKVVKK